MKFLVAFAAGTLAAALPVTVSAQEVEAAQLTELQLAEQIVDRGFPESDRLAMFTSTATDMIAQIRASLPPQARTAKVDAALDAHERRTLAIMDELLVEHLDPLMQGMTVAYSEKFTRAELEGLHALVMSPVGEGLLARFSEVISHPAFAQANQAYMGDFIARVPALQAQLEAEMKAALAQN